MFHESFTEALNKNNDLGNGRTWKFEQTIL